MWNLIKTFVQHQGKNRKKSKRVYGLEYLHRSRRPWVHSQREIFLLAAGISLLGGSCLPQS